MPTHLFHTAQQNRSLYHPNLPQIETATKGSDSAKIGKNADETWLDVARTGYTCRDEPDHAGTPITGVISSTANDNSEDTRKSGTTVIGSTSTSTSCPALHSHSFVICADTQFGMIRQNEDWELEMEYSRQAIAYINSIGVPVESASHSNDKAYPNAKDATDTASSGGTPIGRPLFCCVCGDLVDMTSRIFAGTPRSGKKKASGANGTHDLTRMNDDGSIRSKESSNKTDNMLHSNTNTAEDDACISWSQEDCDTVQDQQFLDFQSIWYNSIHPDIALVCLCGNHDVGNRPNAASIERFTSVFGSQSDYLAFWAKDTYNIVLNTSLFSDPTDAMDLYQEQLEWLEERLKYARQKCGKRCSHIFVFGHHPWFLYDQHERGSTMKGRSALPAEWNKSPDAPRAYIDDAYFHIPYERRQVALDLFARYNVTAAFAGHFHQNALAETTFGMKMITTSSLSAVFQSDGNNSTIDSDEYLTITSTTTSFDANKTEPKDPKECAYASRVGPEKQPQPREPNARGVRIVRVALAANEFDHTFVPVS